MKRIVICCDGTWKTSDEQENEPSRATNVAKVAGLVAPAGTNAVPQITYYHDGVGSGNLGDKILGGAFGVGLSKNIEDAYRFLACNYIEGDEIWLFGFSRGAYTSRSIIGLINNSGLLKKQHLEKFDLAYHLYRDRSKDTNSKSQIAEQFKAQFSYTPDIHFLGVWDTVGSLGIPGHVLSKLLDDMWTFHDVSLSDPVKNAYHALAIDERRDDFKPCIWSNPNSEKRQQVWFSGAHSDVGGGYPEAGLSDCALAWMLCKAEECGLKFDRMNIDIKPDQTAEVHDSKTGFFHLRPGYNRRVEPSVISEAALLKRNQGGYNPDNWPELATPMPCAQNCPKNAMERCWR